MTVTSSSPQEWRMRIGGKAVDAASGQRMPVINPATGETIATVPRGDARDVDAAVQAARAAQPAWGATPVAQRAKVLLAASRLLMERRDEIALLETREHGSPIRKTMHFDVPLCAEQLEYFAGVARGLTGETLPVGPWCHSVAVREPLGVVGLVTPWNFPALMVVWKLGAALVMGNACVVKPPSIAPLTALTLADVFQQAGAPDGTVNVITGPGESAGEALVAHPGVARIGFTGDTATGKRIMRAASDTVKQVGLELGGKNAFIVLEDADLDAAAEGAVFGGFFNSGQVCAAVGACLVHEAVYDAFVARFVEAARRLRVGDPLKPETTLGPVAYQAHRDKIEGHIAQARAEGAALLLGGERPDDEETRAGWFVSPAIFGDCRPDMRLMREEVFGPVVGCMRVASAEEAVAQANASLYGLSASLWTRDVRRGLNLAKEIQAGTVWINEHLIIFSETPWGGCKQSGWGKDLSRMALEEYTHVKHIYLDLTGAVEKPWYGILK